MFGPSPEPGSLEVHHGRGSREVVLFGPSTIAPLGVYPLGRSPSNGDASSEHGAGVDGPHSFVFDGRRSRGVQTAGGGSDGEEYLEGYKPLAFDRSRLRGGTTRLSGEPADGSAAFPPLSEGENSADDIYPDSRMRRAPLAHHFSPEPNKNGTSASSQIQGRLGLSADPLWRRAAFCGPL